ncbi:MAG: NTP transferase domain-containing protein [Chloroflexi bacterium]|nr:NTP transferase domain-containing protein [Chloroflexota bacterium]
MLHEVGGKPMVSHIFEAAEAVATMPPILVVGVDADGVQRLIGSRAQYAMQSEQRGTGHATMMAEPLVKGQADQVIVTYGDMPLLQADTLSPPGANAGQNRGGHCHALGDGGIYLFVWPGGAGS